MQGSMGSRGDEGGVGVVVGVIYSSRQKATRLKYSGPSSVHPSPMRSERAWDGDGVEDAEYYLLGCHCLDSETDEDRDELTPVPCPDW